MGFIFPVGFEAGKEESSIRGYFYCLPVVGDVVGGYGSVLEAVGVYRVGGG